VRRGRSEDSIYYDHAAPATTRTSKGSWRGVVSMAQASYDLARLCRNGLIARRPHANTYDLTPDGPKFAIFYTKVHDRVLGPLFADAQPQAPPQLRAALRTVEQHIGQRLADTRLPAAACRAPNRRSGTATRSAPGPRDLAAKRPAGPLHAPMKIISARFAAAG